MSTAEFDAAAVEERLEGTRFTGALRHLRSVGSTNVLAMEAAGAGATGGVWVADEQTAGRGRGGHRWHSSVGDGLYLSALVRPERPMRADRALLLSLVTGMAAREAIQHAIQHAIGEAGGADVDIRWPNDLLLGGRKCGGILVETAVGAGEANLRYAVIGVGINLNHRAFPEELRELATSVRMEAGRPVPREAVVVALLRGLDREMRELEAEGGEAGVLERFAQASSWVRGKRVRVDEAGGYTGVTAGLDRRGFLQVEGDDGVWHTVLSGGVRAWAAGTA